MPKNYLFLAFLWIFTTVCHGQSIFDIDGGRYDDAVYQENFALVGDDINKRATITEPPVGPVRPMAEWEEIDAITITWIHFLEPLAEIVKHAQKECKVYINCPRTAEEVKLELDEFNVSYGENVIFIENQNFNSIWIRDYGPNSAYLNDVDSLIFVDWIYNRAHRPDDDSLPEDIADHISIPLFETTEGDFKLTATGGNFMSDGIGNAFSSRLVVDENSDKTEDEIDKVMNEFMGIENYVKFDKLVFDGIHHVDMHMKLLDEERIIFGQYPEGEGDYYIIESNIEYLLASQKNAYGEPYEIIRIPMPPDYNDQYPNFGPNPGVFKTYTNALFINKTILVPTYKDIEHDSTALRIWSETMPGYNIQGVDCSQLIGAFGAVHCVTKEIGSKEPLRIVFQKIKNQELAKAEGYPLVAKIQHKTGIAEATLFYREKGALVYDQINMEVRDVFEDTFEATIPDFLDYGTIEYYVEARSKSGKTIARPQPAPEAYYSFDVDRTTSVSEPIENVFTQNAFPNPSNSLVCIPIELTSSIKGELSLVDVHGKQIRSIYSGLFTSGPSKHFLSVSNIASGIYTIRLSSEDGVYSQKLVIKN